MTRGTIKLLAVILAALAATAGSASAEGWEPSVTAATGDNGFSTDVAVDAQGNAVGVWARHVSGLDWQIVASSRPLGGKWSAAVDLSGDEKSIQLRPKVAIDPAGNAVAVWVAKPPPVGNEATPKAIWAASRSPGGTWSQAQKISDASAGDGLGVVIDASGTATAVWHSMNDGEDDPPGVFVRTSSRPLDGAWSAPVELSGATGSNPRVAVNAAGDVTAVWTGTNPDTGNPVVRSKSQPAGGAWSADATDLSSDADNSGSAQVAVDPQGNATAVWSSSSGGQLSLQTAYRDASSGTWSAAETLWDDPTDTALPSVALATDPQDQATAVWSSFAPGGHVVRASSSANGGAWSSPVELSPADGGDAQLAANPRIVADPQGNLTATWAAGSYTNDSLQAARRPEGGSWGSPVDLSGLGDMWSAEIAADPTGYVTALWTDDSIVRSRVFDPVAPLLNSVTVPATGVAGEPIAVSVDPFDVWSPVAISWDFGDGAVGTATTHCYSSPGEYTVAVTGTDGAANATSASRPISIDPDPGAEPGSDPCAPPDPPDDPNPPDDPGPPGPTGYDPQGDSNPAAPVVSALRQSSSRWRTHGTRSLPRLPIGTTFRFKLDRPASVQFTFTRIEAGRLTSSGCVRRTRADRRKPHCARHLDRGTLEMTGRAGSNAFRFRGRTGQTTLEPGRYRLYVSASADDKQSTAAPLEFTIVR